MRKLRILFITGRFFPTKTANTINTKAIMDELCRRGHKVTCIAVDQNTGPSLSVHDSISVYSIRSTRFGRLLQQFEVEKPSVFDKVRIAFWFIIRRTNNILNLCKFPDVDPAQSRAIFRLTERLHKKERFDCVIGVFRPFSGVSAALSMKAKYPDITCGAYYLDLISGAVKPRFIPQVLYDRLCYKGEIKAFNELDFILMAKGGQNIYSASKYANVNSKIQYVDFPVFRIRAANHDVGGGRRGIHLVYAGVLNKSYRNPTHMLTVLQKVSEDIPDIVLHIYGRGNCDSVIESFKESSAYDIHVHGMVSHEDVLSAMQKADFLVNLSNKTQNMVPSKIFELFSTGKPIVNFVSSKNDITKDYFTKYPSVCTLNEWDDIREQVNRLSRFLVEEKGKQYDVEELQQTFVENTPAYTADAIEGLLSCLERDNE